MTNEIFAIESFISFCDDMMITQESVFTTIKNGLIKLFTKLINFLENQISKMKDSKVKRSLLSLLGRAKNGLNKSKNIKEGDDKVVEELKREVNDIQEEANKLNFEYFYPSKTFDDCIKSKKIGALRGLLVGIIGGDPTFVTTEFNEAMQYIDDTSNGTIRLDESYQKQEDEYDLEQSKWTEQYFGLNLVWFRDNFAIKERLPKIKEIGKVVYADKLTFGKAKAMNKK